MTDLRGAFIVKTDDPDVDVVMTDKGAEAIRHDRRLIADKHADTRIARSIEAQIEDWRICGVPRCILIHNGRKVGELLAAS